MRKPKSKKSRRYLIIIIMGTFLFALLGWCGTKYPGWWRGPQPPNPDPEPWWRVGITVLGIAAGIVGGILFQSGLAGDQLFAGQLGVASALGAFAAGNAATQIASSFKG